MSVGCTQLLPRKVVSCCDAHVTTLGQADTAWISGAYGVSGRRRRGLRRGGFVEDVDVMGHAAGRVFDRAQTAPFAEYRAVLAAVPGGAGPVALAVHGGIGLVVELGGQQAAADRLLRLAEDLF